MNDYSLALFELSQEQGTEEELLHEMQDVSSILTQMPEYVTMLDTPAISKEQRLTLVDEAFGSLNPIHLNFLKILCEKHAIKQYPACASAFSDLFGKANGILRAEAITAIPMTDPQKAALSQKLEAVTGKSVRLENTVNTSVLGGVTLRFGGIQLDGTLQSRLDELRRNLAASIV